jgi:uncharacterized surface protein with fasciclin (FAS1) repeats
MNQQALKPVSYGKDGPMYARDDVALYASKMINVGDFFTRKAKHMSHDVENAKAITDRAIKDLSGSIARLTEIEAEFAERAKRMAGSVREASERIAQGVARVEKAANFERLERLVSLLERAATAMGQLATLEEGGKLSKIADAIR